MKTTKTSKIKFSRFNQPARCTSCGRNCLQAGSTSICAECYDDAGLENEHSDTHSASEPVAGCKFCAAAKAAQ